MTLDELFTDDLYDELVLLEGYQTCRNLLDDFATKSQTELKNEIMEVWHTWFNGKGKEEFIEELKEELEKNYKDCEKKEDYPKIINLHHYIRLKNMIDKESKVIGGKREEKTLKIAPALILDVNCQSEALVLGQKIGVTQRSL